MNTKISLNLYNRLWEEGGRGYTRAGLTAQQTMTAFRKAETFHVSGQVFSMLRM